MSSQASLSAILSEYFDKNQDEILEEFFTFLRFESISTSEAHRGETRKCAEWVEKYITDMGFATETWEMGGHPCIYGSWEKAGPDAPTILLYGHYDVQPVDPIELWDSPPFEPTIRDGQIYARGAQDNKGQCFYVLAALKAILKLNKELPLNVKVLIEGEEEVGSVSLEKHAEEYKTQLASDYCLIVDLGYLDPKEPSITLSLRGITSATIELIGSNSDLHSGEHGGVAYNPLHALVEMMAQLRDESGQITVPGFYDDILPLSAEEKSKINFDFDDAAYEAVFGTIPSGGEKKYNALESAGIRPTLEINGIAGGYSGEGVKTVIPARAIAKISCRLIPDQQPEKILNAIEAFLAERVPPGVQLNFIRDHSGLGMRSNPNAKVVAAAAEAYAEITGLDCGFRCGGGSIPMAAKIAKVTGAETALIGFGLGTDNIHAPNEHFGIDRLRMGLASIGGILERLV